VAASATEAVLIFCLVSIIPGTASGPQSIEIIGAITPIIKDAEKQ
jgi:hypothetical protein